MSDKTVKETKQPNHYVTEGRTVRFNLHGTWIPLIITGGTHGIEAEPDTVNGYLLPDDNAVHVIQNSRGERFEGSGPLWVSHVFQGMDKGQWNWPSVIDTHKKKVQEVRI